MERKEAIRYISALLGGSLVGGNLIGCTSADRSATTADSAFLDEVAETILPQTNTPGAKAGKVGAFMRSMVNDCYSPDEQKVFDKGLVSINDLSKKKFKDDFMSITPAQRTEVLKELDTEQKQYTKTKKDDQPAHYFRMMKELALLGFFTSEPGCTTGKRYMPLPGKYIGCVPYKKGEKAIV